MTESCDVKRGNQQRTVCIKLTYWETGLSILRRDFSGSHRNNHLYIEELKSRITADGFLGFDQICNDNSVVKKSEVLSEAPKKNGVLRYSQDASAR